MPEIIFKLRNKETKEELELKFKTTKNPLRMAVRVAKMTRKLKKFDKTHDVIGVQSDNPALASTMRSEILTQKRSIETTGKPDLHGIPDISKMTKGKIKKLLKRKKK